MKTKKLLALMLAGAMTLGCAVPTMANTASSSGMDDISNATGSKTIDVDAVLNKTASDDADPVYAATITWSAGTITGTLKKQIYTWDSANTKYVADTSYTHELEDATVNTPVSIKVTNKSNASIYYSITETDKNSDYTLTHSASPLSVAATEITAADLVDSTGAADSATVTTAREAMKAGNTDTTLTGKSIDSAEYKDTVTLTGTTKTMATAATDVAEYVVTIQTAASSQDVQYAMTGSNAGSKVLSASALLATESSAVSYDDDSSSTTANAVAYNGYISATANANWADANAFVKALNDAGITPADSSKGTSGTWRLLKSKEDAAAWAAATTDEESGFGGVYCLWSSLEYRYFSDFAYYWTCSSGDWDPDGRKAISHSSRGFVVVWDPS